MLMLLLLLMMTVVNVARVVGLDVQSIAIIIAINSWISCSITIGISITMIIIGCMFLNLARMMVSGNTIAVRMLILILILMTAIRLRYDVQ